VAFLLPPLRGDVSNTTADGWHCLVLLSEFMSKKKEREIPLFLAEPQALNKSALE
jgi:hypothetical protein